MSSQAAIWIAIGLPIIIGIATAIAIAIYGDRKPEA
jgi:hypothetical protein